VIGTFCKENEYHLIIDDNLSINLLTHATLLIVEPDILIPTTQITNAYPCVRKAYLDHQFKSKDISYALVYVMDKQFQH
jgi:hypothetical protein